MKKRPTPKNGKPSAQDSRKDIAPEEQTEVILSLPKRGTVLDALLDHLLTGASLTQPEWLLIDGSWRLAASVEELKKDHGWPVDSIDIPAPTKRRPTRKIARYRLQQWAIQKGREMRGGGL